MEACLGQQMETVEFLLSLEDLDVNVQNEKGETALMAAASVGNMEIVRLLFKLGADPELKDCRGWDAGDWAIQLSSWNFIKYQGSLMIS